MALLLAACLSALPAWAQTISPGPNLVADGVPAIPRALADRVEAYAEFWPQRMLAWHPERREMLISRRAGNTTQVFALSGAGAPPEQLTRYVEPVASASFPRTHGRYFLFSKDEGGNERYQLWRHDVTSGAAVQLTDGRRRHGTPVWARDTERIAYTSVAVGAERDSRQVQVEVRSMDPRDPASDRLIAILPGAGWWLADWSPDGKWLALSEYVSANESYLWLLDAASGERRALTPRVPGVRAAHLGAEFSADGRSLYTTTDRGGEFLQLAELDLASGALRVLSAHISWDVDGFELSPDGARLAFVANEDGASRLHVIEPRSGRAITLPPYPHGVISGLRWRLDGGELAFNFSSARVPAGVVSLPLAQASLVNWTTTEKVGADPAGFVEPELVRWQSFDGRMISGYLYRPPARFAGARPVLMEIHGGPESQTRPSFRGRLNYFVDQLGIALLLPNVRGSSGYGKTFLSLDDGRLREESVRDIGAALDWIAATPGLDAGRVLVSGGSYGGYMSLATATLYPTRIACAVSSVGISNFVSFLANTESYRRDLRRSEYGDERDPAMRAFLESISPLNRAERIVRPLLVIQGANDPRVPRSESEQIVATLRRLERPVWYLLAMDEGHGFAKKANADFELYTRIVFAERCLGANG